MNYYQTVLFKSIILTFSLIAFYILLTFVLTGLFSSSSPYDLILLAIDFSFVIFIFVGFKILKSNRSAGANFVRTLLYFVIALFLSTIWFIFSPIVALNDKEWNVELHFSSKSLHQVISNPISFQAYRFLKIILFGPILEEFFYRRIILSSLLEKHSAYFAILLSSLLFSIGHMDFDYTIVFFVFGILIGTFYWKTRNIYFTIVIHMFINLLTVFFI